MMYSKISTKYGLQPKQQAVNDFYFRFKPKATKILFYIK